MNTGNADADEAVLDLPQRDEGLMMDDLICTSPEVELAVQACR